MTIIADAEDPDGHRVVLDQDGWDHILRGHEVMARHKAAIIATVTSPDHREADPVFSERERLYRRGWGPSAWMLVVVDRGVEPARVITAFPLRVGPS